MSLRSEIADKLDADSRLEPFFNSRQLFREGSAACLDRCFGKTGDAIARAVLEVIDTYEEVEVHGKWQGLNKWAYFPGDSEYERTGNAKHFARRTIYMKKEKPAPTVEELTQRAVEAWLVTPEKTPFDDAMAALAEKLKP